MFFVFKCNLVIAFLFMTTFIALLVDMIVCRLQAGYFLNSTGNDDISDCLECTPGKYCAGGGNYVPDDDCAAGWYCPGGQDDPRPTGYNCTLGE